MDVSLRCTGFGRVDLVVTSEKSLFTKECEACGLARSDLVIKLFLFGFFLVILRLFPPRSV